MRRKCCIPCCKTKDGPNRKYSLFQVPNNSEQLAEWKKIIVIDFEPIKHICERHFQPHYIPSCFYQEDQHGNVLLNASINQRSSFLCALCIVIEKLTLQGFESKEKFNKRCFDFSAWRWSHWRKRLFECRTECIKTLLTKCRYRKNAE